MARRVVVTGGAGFIGSNLVNLLNSRSPDWSVTVIDDLSTGLRENLADSDCELVVGSVLDDKLLEDTFFAADHIVHLAAIGSVPRSVASPRPTHDANITGTLNVLEAARKQTVSQVVVASSSSVYGSNPKLPRSESDWLRPLSPYAVTKLASEAYANAYSASYGLDTVAFRFFNVYGPRQRSDHPYAAVIPKFISAMLTGTPLLIHGDGLQTRDFTFVTSVCEAIHATLLGRLGFPSPINLAFGSQHSLLDVVGMLESLSGQKLELEHSSPRVGDVSASRADATMLQTVLPSVRPWELQIGLKLTLEWFESVRNT